MVSTDLFPESFAIRIAPPAPEEPPEAVHAHAMMRGAKCRECPSWNCKQGPVMGTIRPGARLIAIGEAPGGNEVLKKEGFVGASGAILDAALREGGLERTEVSLSNTILCMPPDGGNFSDYVESLRSAQRRREKAWERTWLGRPGDGVLTSTQRSATAHKRWQAACVEATRAGLDTPVGPPKAPLLPHEACRPRLERDIAESGATVILAVGKQALEGSADILGLRTADEAARVEGVVPVKVASIKRQHGAPILLPDGRVLIASYHPAFAMRDKREYMPVIKSNIKRAAQIAMRSGAIDWREPQYLLTPDPDTIKRTLYRFLELKAEVTVDIETDGIDAHACKLRCVGLGANLWGEEVITVIPFNHMDGSPWWDEETKIELALLVRRVMDELPLVFQNGTFDTTVMLRVGLMTNRSRSWSDTLIYHHDTPDNDLPHDLGFITRRYFEVPLWKENVDHKTVSNASNYFLHLYNARDVLATMRVVVPLRYEIVQAETQRQVHTDTTLLPLIRDMSEMGMHVNEWLRGKYSTHLNGQCQQLAREFGKSVGRPINPRSGPQLRDLLYVDWKYIPVLTTDGEDYDNEDDDTEDASTSNAALTRLLSERAVTPEHRIAIDTLLKFRANDKLRGTYTDKLHTYLQDWRGFGFDDLVGRAPVVMGLVYDAEKDLDVPSIILPERSGISLARTTFKSHVVPTGRMASGDPVNFQNIPKFARGGLNLRSMFVAPPGHVFVGAVYEQIEARLYAVIAQDRLLLEAIRKGYDIHSLNAASLLCKPGESLLDEYARVLAKPKEEKTHIRTVAKRFCFGLIYGAGWQKIYQVMIAERNKGTGELTFPGLQEKDCQEWEANWHRLHPETRAWHARCWAAFDEYGFTGVPMLDFRRRFFPGGTAFQDNAIPNLTIQGSAASIANQAFAKLVERVPFRKWSRFSGVVAQVHDFLMVCVPESRYEEAARHVGESMFFRFEGMDFVANPEISWDWGAQ